MFCKILILSKVCDKTEEMRANVAEKVVGAQNLPKPVLRCQCVTAPPSILSSMH